MILFIFEVYFFCAVCCTCVQHHDVSFIKLSLASTFGYSTIATSAGFFILLAIFASWIRFVSQTEVSYSKLLARYQSRNGSWFAVNRKHKVKQKRVKRSFGGNADY